VNLKSATAFALCSAQLALSGTAVAGEAAPSAAPEGPASGRSQHGSDARFGPSDGSFVQGLIGAGPTLRRASHDELNQLFADQGLSALSHNLLAFGLLVQGSLQRFRASFGWDFIGNSQDVTRVSDTETIRVPVSQRLLSFGVGYDVVQTLGFAVFPSLGFTVGDLTLKYDPRAPLWQDDDLKPRDNKEEAPPIDVTRGFNALDVGLGLEQVIPFERKGRAHSPTAFGLALGLRLGYRWQLSDTAWTYFDKNDSVKTLTTGPALDGAGPYMQLVLGVGVTQ